MHKTSAMARRLVDKLIHSYPSSHALSDAEHKCWLYVDGNFFRIVSLVHSGDLAIDLVVPEEYAEGNVVTRDMEWTGEPFEFVDYTNTGDQYPEDQEEEIDG